MPKNLKALRESLNLQQKEFCEPFGIKPNTYSNYEIGITEPKISFWKAVAIRKRPGDPGRSLIFAAFGGMRRAAVD